MIRLPNWLRITWWLILTFLVTYYLYQRYSELLAGRSAIVDVFVFLVWAALLLVPIFKEVGFFGVTLKQEIKEAKNELKEQILELKSQISNTIDIRPNINVYAPAPPDASLPAIEQQIKQAVSETRARQPGTTPAVEPKAEVSDDVTYLFSVRFGIERELRRLWQSRFPDSPSGQKLAGLQLTRILTDAQILPPDLARAVREVYSICSLAVHAEDVSPAKVKFVRDVAPELIATLKSLQ